MLSRRKFRITGVGNAMAAQAATGDTMRFTVNLLKQLLIAVLCYAQFPLCGQETRGTLLGRVVDQTGAVIVGVNLEAINPDTGVRTPATTNK